MTRIDPKPVRDDSRELRTAPVQVTGPIGTYAKGCPAARFHYSRHRVLKEFERTINAHLVMAEPQVKSRIAKLICGRFMMLHESTPRQMILRICERRDLLSDLQFGTLFREASEQNNYLPTCRTFALLGDAHRWYAFARSAFIQTSQALYWQYRASGDTKDYAADEFGKHVCSPRHDPLPDGLVALGLYFAQEFALIQPTEMAEDRCAIRRFRISEFAIEMRDPIPVWHNRVQGVREPLRRFTGPVPQLEGHVIDFSDPYSTPAQPDEFWTLIHPTIVIEARPRFEGAQYADAVEAALKVVAHEVRRRSGLTLDGADLMHRAFSPHNPHLVFQDPIPDTQASMQQGYMRVFAGAMMAVRNPKAHGLVKIDRRRAIHFLFLASLLADKIDEATDACQNSMQAVP